MYTRLRRQCWRKCAEARAWVMMLITPPRPLDDSETRTRVGIVWNTSRTSAKNSRVMPKIKETDTIRL